jgi:adenylate kinase
MIKKIEKVFQVEAESSREAFVADGVPRLGQTYVVTEVTVNQYRPRLFNVCVSLEAQAAKIEDITESRNELKRLAADRVTEIKRLADRADK